MNATTEQGSETVVYVVVDGVRVLKCYDQAEADHWADVLAKANGGAT